MVFLEDIVKETSSFARLRALLIARLAPAQLVAAWYGGRNRTPDSLATVIFSSGSTGTPKGVMLSHYNIVSNIDAVSQVFRIGSRDRIIGVLPFFHSLGFTVTIWLPLLAGCGVAYHPNPTDARAIGELVAKYKGTFLLSTPTFCASYARKCRRQDFGTLRSYWWGPRSCVDRWRRRSRRPLAGSSWKAMARLRCRPSWPSMRPTFTPGRTRKPETSRAPWAIRSRESR